MQCEERLIGWLINRFNCYSIICEYVYTIADKQIHNWSKSKPKPTIPTYTNCYSIAIARFTQIPNWRRPQSQCSHTASSSAPFGGIASAGNRVCFLFCAVLCVHLFYGTKWWWWCWCWCWLRKTQHSRWWGNTHIRVCSITFLDGNKNVQNLSFHAYATYNTPGPESVYSPLTTTCTHPRQSTHIIKIRVMVVVDRRARMHLEIAQNTHARARDIGPLPDYNYVIACCGRLSRSIPKWYVLSP